MNGTRLRRIGLACVVAAALPACQPAGAGSIHVDRIPLKLYSSIPNRKVPGPRPVNARHPQDLPRASVPGR
jgi:hypothetical protein